MLTHDELTRRALKWLRGTMGCSIVISEFTNTSEQPDAMGWGRFRSVVVECKASRADFLRDKKKWHRGERAAPDALGDERWYFTNPGIIKPDELPDGWFLAEVRGSRVMRVVKPKDINDARRFPPTASSLTKERDLLISLARRLVGYSGEAEQQRVLAMQNGTHHKGPLGARDTAGDEGESVKPLSCPACGVMVPLDGKDPADSLHVRAHQFPYDMTLESLGGIDRDPEAEDGVD